MERKHWEQFLVLENKNNVAGASKSPQYNYVSTIIHVC